MVATTRVLNIRLPEDLHRRAKAVAGFNGMTLKAFIIECLEQRLERERGWLTHAPCPEEEPVHLISTRLGDGWRCSNESCSWEIK